MIKNKRIIALTIACSLVLGLGVTKVVSASSEDLNLSVTQNRNNPEIQLGVKINPADLWKEETFNTNTGFNLNYWGNGNGKQSWSTYNGLKCIKVDNLTNGGGNCFNPHAYPGYTGAVTSVLDLNDRYTCSNGQWVSITCKIANPNSIGTLRLVAHGGRTKHDYSIFDRSNYKVKYRYAVNYQNKIIKDTTKIYCYTDNTANNYVPDFDNGQLYSISFGSDNTKAYYYNSTLWKFHKGTNKDTSYFTPNFDLDAGTASNRQPDIRAGDTLLTPNNYGYGKYMNVSEPSSDWKYYSANIKLKGTASDYDCATDGLNARIQWGPNNPMYLTDLCFGKASPVRVYRGTSRNSCTEWVNTGEEVYNSNFVDENAKVLPESPIIGHMTTGPSIMVIPFTGGDSTKTYYYKAVRYDSSNHTPIETSDIKEINLKSIKSKYKVIIKKNGNPYREFITQDKVELPTSDFRRGDIVGITAYTLDQNGLQSTPKEISYRVTQTLPDLKDDIHMYLEELHPTNATDREVVKEQLLGLRTNSLLPYNVRDISTHLASKYMNGHMDVNCMLDEELTESVLIPCKDEYQTKSEFKSDVESYISSGNITESVSYSDYRNIKETLEETLNTECKDNPSLNDVEIDVQGGSTEFSEGEAQIDVYYKNS